MERGVYLPDTCSNCRKRTLKLDEKASKFMNIQRAEIQELLERVRSGSPASHIELFIDDDLCNTIVPGDTIEVVGIVRLRQVGKAKDPIYSKYIDVVSIRNTQREFEEVELTKEDIQKIIEFARQPNVFDIITNSIAPSIYGHRELLCFNSLEGIQTKFFKREGKLGATSIFFLSEILELQKLVFYSSSHLLLRRVFMLAVSLFQVLVFVCTRIH